jgi:L,D-peptidoglycan transpeptidase YkuD (ErfK/YbiS/YcfS/YnhG family)
MGHANNSTPAVLDRRPREADGSGVKTWLPRAAGRRSRIAVAALLCAAAMVPLAPAPAGSATTSPLPERLRSIGDARQVIVVTAPNWSDPRAGVELWEKNSKGWARVMSTRGRLGWSGFEWASQRRQGDGSTPVGTFSITRTFGLRADPGTDMPYRRAWRNDYWVYDKRCPATYNSWRKYSANRCWRTSWAEKLTDYRAEYEFAAIINFNIPTPTKPADTRRGGGIFLHVHGDGPTAGCVSVRRADMLRIMRWLDPAKKPRIVMGPRSVLSRL